MAWIRVVGPAEAQGELAQHYAGMRKPDGSVDNILAVHGLNPASLEARWGQRSSAHIP